MEFTGKVIAVLPKNGGVSQKGNAWASQQYVLDDGRQYPKRVCFEVFGEDKINEFGIKMGELLKIQFDITADEYNGRWYNRLRAWAVERVSELPTQQKPAADAPSANGNQVVYQKPPKKEEPEPETNDQLPF